MQARGARHSARAASSTTRPAAACTAGPRLHRPCGVLLRAPQHQRTWRRVPLSSPRWHTPAMAPPAATQQQASAGGTTLQDAPDVQAKVAEWLLLDGDAESRGVIEALAAQGATQALRELLCQRLEFGACVCSVCAVCVCVVCVCVSCGRLLVGCCCVRRAGSCVCPGRTAAPRPAHPQHASVATPPPPAHAGTAGLRAKMGPGFSRMNAVTIQQTTQGLLRYLQAQAPAQLAEHGVIIGARRWGSMNTCALSLSRAHVLRAGRRMAVGRWRRWRLLCPGMSARARVVCVCVCVCVCVQPTTPTHPAPPHESGADGGQPPTSRCPALPLPRV
jgi:hypothetical protein